MVQEAANRSNLWHLRLGHLTERGLFELSKQINSSKGETVTKELQLEVDQSSKILEQGIDFMSYFAF